MFKSVNIEGYIESNIERSNTVNETIEVFTSEILLGFTSKSKNRNNEKRNIEPFT